MYHVKAWCLWLVAALCPFLLTKNPFYLTPALVAVGVVYRSLDRDAARARSWGSFLRLGLALAATGVIFNSAFVGVGATVLVRLPPLRLSLGVVTLQVGGAITLESLAYGLTQALAIFGVLLVLAAFNSSVNHYELLRHAPRFAYQSAAVLSIAVTLVPEMVAAQSEIREAQSLRGHRFRRLRDLLPLFLVLLAEGLERSITLAESMCARGFGGPTVRTPRAASQLQTLITFGLMVWIGGAAALTLIAEKIVGAAMIVLGGAVVAAVLWRVGLSVRCSRYTRVRWQTRDSILAGASLLVLLVFVRTWAADPAVLVFYPYPRLTLPSIHLSVVACTLLLGVPAAAQWNHEAVDD